MRNPLSWLSALLAACVSPAFAAVPAAPVNGFGIVAIIPLPGVTGRIDHLAYDAADQTVFVAALGNNTVEVVDVASRRVEHRLAGFDEPQGVAWSAALGRLYVASGDGKVKSFIGKDLAPGKSIDLGGDADNVRIDEKAQRVYVGHGQGAIAVLDARTLAKIADLPLAAHPESFQLAPADARVFVNVPGANEITVLDRANSKGIAHWANGETHANFPMAIDVANARVLVVFRKPARLVAHDLGSGAVVREVPTCNDADDVFVDEKRHQVYVVCGEGVVDVLASPGLERVARLPTAAGARTGLFRADVDRLFVAARANGSAAAALWVLAPAP